MGVYINGLGMPERCKDCICHRVMTDALINQHWCGADGQQIIHPNRIREDCPMVEVKTPHGRLIDADEMMDKYWDGNSMTITKDDAKHITTVIEAEE